MYYTNKCWKKMDGMFTGGDNPEGPLPVMGFGIDCKSTFGKGYGGKMNETIIFIRQ